MGETVDQAHTFPFDYMVPPETLPGRRSDGINYSRLIGRAVGKKWPSAIKKEWWFSKFTIVRRKKTTQLFHKQNGLCYFCGQQSWLHGNNPNNLRNNRKATLEHVVTQAQGGTDHMSNLIMSCSGCNNLRGDMKFGKFLKLRRNPDAWSIYCKMKAQALQDRKGKVKEKRKDAKVAAMWRLAVLFYLRPEWIPVAEEIRRFLSDQQQKLRERHEYRVANSHIDFEDIIV